MKKARRVVEELTWPLLKTSIAIFSALPREKAVRFFLAIFRPFVKKRMEIALKNIEMVGLEDEEELARRSIESFVESMWEILRYGRDAEVRESFVFKTDILDNLKGKGVIAIGLHLGNFPLMCAALNRKGYKTYPVMRRVHNRPLGNFIDKLARSYGVEVIYDKPRTKATAKILKKLKERGIVFLAMDQTASREDPMVPFFGVPVPTFKGPVILHYRTKLPVVPLYTYREGIKNIVVAEDPIDPLFNGDIQKDLEIVNKTLERIILKHPEHWFWFHRRWKRAKGAPEGR